MRSKFLVFLHILSIYLPSQSFPLPTCYLFFAENIEIVISSQDVLWSFHY